MPLNSLKPPLIHAFKMGEFMVCKLPINKTVKTLKRILFRRLGLMKSCLSLTLYSYYFLWKLFENLLDIHAEQSSVYFNCSKDNIAEVNCYFLFSNLHASCGTKGEKGAISLVCVTEMFAPMGCLGRHSWLSQSIKIPG